MPANNETSTDSGLRHNACDNWGCFALGFLFGLFGVLIAHLIPQNSLERSESAKQSAWWGFLCGVVAWVVAAVVLLAAFTSLL